MGIKFTDELQKRVDNGELVPLVLIFHRPDTDKLVIFSLGALSISEAEAMLSAYDFAVTSSGAVKDV